LYYSCHQVRSTKAYAWSGPLHYINTPDWVCDYVRSRDCIANGMINFCVDGAIQNYTARVSDTSLPFDQQAEALKFFVHFFGDIHQPLHCGFTSDEGGNTLKGTFEGSSTNLHSVWDTGILTKRMAANFGANQTTYANYLLNQIRTDWAPLAKQWVECESTGSPYGACSEEWGNESTKLSCEYSYVEADGTTHITNNFVLGDPYYERNYPIVDMQLAKAGVRMAYVMNQIWP